MENLSHSRQTNKSSTTHSKKPCNGTNFITRTTYDDVFGGPPKFAAPQLAPRVEDYSEIFCGFQSSRASSIPVLDLPVVDDEDVFFDVSSTGFDYNEVFGGYDALDSAVSFEDLVMDQNDAVNADVDSSEEAWTPAETESFSEESDHSGKNKSLSNAESYESIDGTMEFNISYHKANQRSDGEMSNGITHVAELQAVPGFTFLVDKTTPLEKRYENPPVQVTDENSLHMDFSGGMMREKNLRKTLSEASSSNAGEQPFENGLKPQRRYVRNSSLPNETFVTVSEISLRTQPSEVPPPCRPAPPLDVKKEDSSRLDKISKPSASEGTGGDTSPPFFDVEVDASSSAAASAAAMKEAMEKAQAKLKSAKELLERKRDGVQRRKSDKKDREGKLYGNIDGSSSVLNERVSGTSGRQENGMKYSVREQKQKGMKTTKAVPDLLEGEKLFNVDEKLVEKHRRPDKIDGAAEWIEETQFFELVRTDRSTFGQANSDEILMADAQIHEQTLKKGAIKTVERREENCKKIKGNREDHILGENEKKLKVAKEACEQQESNGRLEASKATRKQKGHDKKLKVAQEVCEQGESEKKINVVRHHGDIEKKPTEADELEKHENPKMVHHSENLFEGEKAVKYLENELPLKETNRSKENLTRLKASHEQANDERRQGEASEKEQNEKKLKEVAEQVKLEEGLKEALKQVENDKKQQAYEREESEKRMREALEQTENEKRKEENEKQRQAFERRENERRLKEVCELKDNEKKQREGPEREENEKKLREALDKEENERKQKEAFEREETEKRLQEACEVELMEKKHKGASEAEDVKGINMVQEQTQLDENGKKLKVADGPHEYMEGEDLRLSDKECMLVDNRKVQATRLAGQQEENGKTVQVTQRAFAHEENGKIQTEHRDCELEFEAVEFMNVPVDGKFEVSGIAQGHSEHEAHKYRNKDVAEPLSQEHIVRARGESGTAIGSEKNKSAFEMDSDTKTQGKKCDDEWGERESIKQAHVGIHQKVNKDKFMPTHPVKESVQIGRKMEADQPSVLEGKGNIQRTAYRVNASHSERKEKNFKETLTLEEKEAERIKRERELEKERLRRIEEERDREREREKDRMAVDIAILEAREKAYADARERAERSAVERVTADARQRVLVEARERLEKACAEVKEKSIAEKTPMEARLRAERAAVERATAEARERAVEKAMAERAAFEARERGSFPEKFSAASRYTAVRPNSSSNDLQDHKFKSAGSSNYSRYPYSSGYGASYNTNRTEGVEVESAQRCKARLERHRRTAERAAKALAEKNMRDLLAQREQAERNRLAETLDADVKRWSSGKEGNLRALLSTLQYILGPDSGWHPIPLTEVITSAAVKKVYRKATLCVHPDKLQQRGASIQQKYICEKVFDLLKEAWNKFNSEER